MSEKLLDKDSRDYTIRDMEELKRIADLMEKETLRRRKGI